VKCPRCSSDKISRIKTRRQFDCDGCRYQFSVRVGTVLQDSKLPLWKWFLAVYMIGESKKGVSANQLKRMLGVSYKTAWFLCHRIRSAMVQGAGPLTGTVEVDETYYGGKRSGHGKGYLGNKTMIVGAIQRGGELRVKAMPSNKKLNHKLSREFIAEHVDDKAEFIYTDESPGYPDLTDWNTKHRRVNHQQEEWVNGDIHTNTVESAWSLFDRAVIGSYHKLSVKHLNAYLDEFAYRFNNRDNPFLFRDTILALVEADALTFKELTNH